MKKPAHGIGDLDMQQPPCLQGGKAAAAEPVLPKLPVSPPLT